MIPAPKGTAAGGKRAPPRKIYAIKKLLNRCDYFDAMFHGGFGEGDGNLSDEGEDGLDPLSDSDGEDEAMDLVKGPHSGVPRNAEVPYDGTAAKGTNTPPGTDGSGNLVRNGQDNDDGAEEGSHDGAETSVSGRSSVESDESDEETDGSGAGRDPAIAAAAAPQASRKRAREDSGATVGPRKTRVIVRDAAWSTWWAVLYWVSYMSE